MEIVSVVVAPVPVGHRVRVTWYEEVREGLAGQVRREERPHEPVIEDLETGVVYQSDWAVGTGRRQGPDLPYAIEFATLPDHEVQREVTGTVTACRLVTVRGYADLEVQTHLTIDPD